MNLAIEPELPGALRLVGTLYYENQVLRQLVDTLMVERDATRVENAQLRELIHDLELAAQPLDLAEAV